MTVMPLDWVLGCDRVVSKPILDLDVGICTIWPHKGCLYISSCNPMGHNKDVVSTWGGMFVTSHIGYGRNFLSLYKYGLLST